ncbi:MAG: serine/threonine protein kinase [Kiritimatiellae bacterium]|nr:serine/threonine protein kinase [Kiritimatiellia bacterium]
MEIRFECRQCQTRLEVDVESAGTVISCPNCGESQTVPRRGLGPGTVVGGFQIIRLIGRGGMGEVYLARQRSLDRLVALKVLSRYLAPSPEAAERFIREMRLMARLEHPYLVTAYEGGEDSGVVYLAMAYVRGSSLHERVRTHGPLSEGEALAIGRKVASALQYAWQEMRLLHRDIKPSNILLDAHGEPKLADLGLAKCLGQSEAQTLSGAVLGTPNYMSPEQAEGREDLDVRSDIYSLGATLYTAVTGEIPYQAASLVEVLRRAATEPLPDPRTFAPRLSAEFVELLGQLLARDRRQRPADWAEAIAAFDRLLVRYPGALGALPAAEVVPAAGGEGSRWSRATWPVRVLVGGAIAASLVLGVATGHWWTRRRPSHSEGTEPALPTEPAIPVAGEPAPPADQPPTASAAPAPPLPAPREEDFHAPGRPPLTMEQRRRLARLWGEAREYLRSRPDDPEGQLARFRRIVELAPNSPVARQVEKWIADSGLEQRVRRRQLEREMRRLTDEAIASGRIAEAIEQIERAAAGPHAAETAALREELLRRLRGELEAVRRRELERRRDAAIDTAADAALRGQWAAAQAALATELASPDLAAEQRAPLEEAAALIAEATGWPAAVLASFRSQRGQQIAIEFRDGRTETLQIHSVQESAVVARRILPEGFIERTFTPAELSWRERLSRAGPKSPAVRAFLEGCWLLEDGDRENAAAAFSASRTALGAALQRRLTSAPPGARSA